MKLKLIITSFALAGVLQAAPEGLATGIPAFLLDENGQISEAARQAFVEARKEAAQGQRPVNWDTDGDGVLSEEERQAAVAELRARADARRAELFAKAAGADGLLTAAEFATLPAMRGISPETIEKLFALLDIENTGEVTLQAFLAGIRGSMEPPSTGPTMPFPPR
jgi:hypothetical protein